jgi:hypothetical protein
MFHSPNCDVLQMKILIFLPADDSPNENMTLLPAGDSLDEIRDSNKKHREADCELV